MSDDPGQRDDEAGWAAPPPTDPWGNPMPQSPPTPPAPGGGQPPPTGGEPSDWWGDPAAGGEQAAAMPDAASYEATPYATGPPRTEPKAIWGLVLSIVGLIVCGVILEPIAVALGFLARKSIRESHGTLKGDGLAVAAIVIGIVGFVLSVIVAVWVATNPHPFDELEAGAAFGF